MRSEGRYNWTIYIHTHHSLIQCNYRITHTVICQHCSTTIIHSISSTHCSLAQLSKALTLTHSSPPPVPVLSSFTLLPHPFFFLTFLNGKGQLLIEHMVQKEANSCNAVLTSRPPAVRAKTRKTRELHLQRHQYT